MSTLLSARTLWVVVSFAALSGQVLAQQAQPARAAVTLPRDAHGKPDLQGIWMARGTAAYDLQTHAAGPGVPAGTGVVEGGEIPYQPSAIAKKRENFNKRRTTDPLGKCYFPGVPRIMYLAHPFQIFQTAEHVAIAFEWSSTHRLIYTNGKPPLHEGVESWMGSSRGNWEGDTLVVKVTDHNDKTWFDMAGNYHSDALGVTERYTMLDADTIRYEATMEDSKVFTKPWKISLPLVRQKNVARLMESECQAEVEEANGAFERDPRTWYPKPGQKPSPVGATDPMPAGGSLPPVQTGANLPRTADGKPDLTGYYQADSGNANQGLEKHAKEEFTPATRGAVIDPPGGMLPYRPWARQEQLSRQQPYRGYDDPTAHCFVAGVPRSMYVPSPHQILQPPGYVLLLFERMSWRIIPMDGRPHIPDNIRLWQGDSVGHWEGDTLVVDTTNLNGKTWLNEYGDFVSHAEHVVEHFIPVDAGKIIYRATVTDPIVFSRPWTIEMPLRKQAEELLEVACNEDNGDLQHLKDIRDEYRAKQLKEKTAR
ncbi:MAG TPA: hypothetical protein VNH18_03690 [Bryobacteraceae bacterium]|nr:hypothetical protein [Bryobacteraceae bacterium]